MVKGRIRMTTKKNKYKEYTIDDFKKDVEPKIRGRWEDRDAD